MIRHTCDSARFTAVASPCGSGVLTDIDGRRDRDGLLAVDDAAQMIVLLRALALQPEKGPAALASVEGNEWGEGFVSAALEDPSSAFGIASCLEHAVADCVEVVAGLPRPNALVEAAVQIVAERMYQRYYSQYQSDQISWKDFADDARGDLQAAWPALATLVRPLKDGA